MLLTRRPATKNYNTILGGLRMSCEKANAQDALRQYVAKAKVQLQELLHRLNWSEAGVLQSHRSPTKRDEISLEQLPPSCCSASEHSVQLTSETLQMLLPEKRQLKALPESNTFQDLQINYSAAEKLAIYEHVVSRTPRQRFSFEQQANFAHLVAETRRAHQKQRRHRKSKPTLHEEMQQLVQLQMQALQQQHENQRRSAAAAKRHTQWDPKRGSPNSRRSSSPSWGWQGSGSQNTSQNRSRGRSKSPSDTRCSAGRRDYSNRTKMYKERCRSPRKYRSQKRSRSRSRRRSPRRSRYRSPSPKHTRK